MRHHSIPEPDPDLVVWRYMEFKHFRDLVATKELHLTRLDQFADKHEGYIPASGSPPSASEIASQGHAWAWRHLTFASCWHVFPEEDSLMWPSYGGVTEGVAVRSTAGKLSRIADLFPNSYIVEVVYDLWPNPVPPGGHWQLPIRKRPQFASEAELRMIHEDVDLMIVDDFPQLGEPPPGHWPTFKRVGFELHPLIDEIRLNPGASADLESRVTSAARGAGFNCPLTNSTLTPEPVWFDPNS